MKRPNARKRDRILSVEFPKDLWRYIEDMSESTGESKGSCVRVAVRSMVLSKGLKQHEPQK